jgi:uncharacterized membrane protein YfcA
MGVADLLAVLSGGAVGFALGLVGGGGSILAVPLLLYVVGIGDPHLAIGTSALAVSANAFANLAMHARAGTVKWPCALVFAVSGVAGAAAGSTAGKAMDGERLLFLFGLVMVAVALAMLRPRAAGAGDADVRLTAAMAPKLVATGLVVGGVSGFFGIGGGFLIVPGLILGSGMAILNAVGSSLVSVGLFGATTAANYALSGLVAWDVAAEFVAGGVAGGFAGMTLAKRLAATRGLLSRVFAGIVLTVAAYVLWRSGGAVVALFA